jgi:hypothetical protein
MRPFSTLIAFGLTLAACSSTHEIAKQLTAMTTPREDGSLAAMASAVDEVARFLEKHGDVWVVKRMDRLKAAADRGDIESISWAVSESTGGMGSLKDRQFGPEEGDAADNAQFRELIENVEQTARAAALAHGVRLVR